MPSQSATTLIQADVAVAIDDLPTGIRSMTLADAEGDARHLGAMISAALDKLVPMGVVAPDVRAELQSATAMLWVARDLAEVLEWKLERMDRLPGGRL